MPWRYLPLAGVVVLIAITCCVRPLLQRRRHGTLGLSLFRSGRAGQHLRDAMLVVLVVAIVWQAAAEALRVRSGPLLVAEDGSLLAVLRMAGASIMLAGIALLAIAQLHLGPAWRIGIEEGARPGLVTAGLYRYSRNPIYLGLLGTIAGYAMLLPTLLSLVLLAATFVGVRLQTAAEEEYLTRTYGDSYRDYARGVGRFLPWLGRVRR
jgi:protein-S-isoprenylcysteine O-methyltransferase Ste14